MRPPVCEKEIKYFLGGGGCRFCFLRVIFEIFIYCNCVFFSADSYFYFIISLSLFFVLVRIGVKKPIFYFLLLCYADLINILQMNVYELLLSIILILIR